MLFLLTDWEEASQLSPVISCEPSSINTIPSSVHVLQSTSPPPSDQPHPPSTSQEVPSTHHQPPSTAPLTDSLLGKRKRHSGQYKQKEHGTEKQKLLRARDRERKSIDRKVKSITNTFAALVAEGQGDGVIVLRRGDNGKNIVIGFGELQDKLLSGQPLFGQSDIEKSLTPVDVSSIISNLAKGSQLKDCVPPTPSKIPEILQGTIPVQLSQVQRQVLQDIDTNEDSSPHKSHREEAFLRKKTR